MAYFFASAMAWELTNFAAAKDCRVDASQHPSAASITDGDPCRTSAKWVQLSSRSRSIIYWGLTLYTTISIYGNLRNSYKHQQLAGGSFNSRIRYFSIRIRLSDLCPVETQTELDRFKKSQASLWPLPTPDDQWIFVQFNYPSSLPPSEFILKRYSTGENNPPYTFKKDTHVNGLDHYVSYSSASYSPEAEDGTLTKFSTIQLNLRL